MQEIRPRWSSTTKLIIILLCLGLGVFLLDRFKAAIQPFVLAVILAYVLSPLVNRLQGRFRIHRVLIILFVYLIGVAVVIAILLVIIPQLSNQAAALTANLKQLPSQVETFLGKSFSFAGQTINLDGLIQQAIGSIQGLVEPVVSRTLDLALGVISSLVWVVFILVVSFYLIKDGQALQRWIENHFPPDYREDYIQLRQEINLIWSSFFRGQLALTSVVAIIFIVIGLIIGLPFALTMGVLAGLLEFLPSLGHGIWLTIASIMAFFIGSAWLPLPNWAFALLVIGLHVIFEQFDLNYLIPRIIGRRVHLPPLVVILGIVTGGLLAGFLGIFLAAPTIASARVLGHYVYANLFDRQPFPDTSDTTMPPPNPRWWRKSAAGHSSKSSEQQERL
jgi:predicted PurR-regulated permease PerM